MTSYYKRNKQAIKDGIKYKASLRDIKIHNSILDYDTDYFKRSKSSRRSLLHNILIGEFDINLPYLNTSYNDFVNKYNDQYEIEEESVFLNCDNYRPKPFQEKKKEPYFIIEEEEEPETDYTIQGDTSDSE